MNNGEMTRSYAFNLVHQFGSAECWPRANEIAEYMVRHNECVAHAAFVVMQLPVCQCSPCRKARKS